MHHPCPAEAWVGLSAAAIVTRVASTYTDAILPKAASALVVLGVAVGWVVFLLMWVQMVSADA